MKQVGVIIKVFFKRMPTSFARDMHGLIDYNDGG